MSEQQQPEQKRSWFRRHKILTGLGAVIGVIIIAAIFSGGGSSQPAPDPAAAGAENTGGGSSSSNSEKADKKADEKKLPGIGDSVSDGNLTFTVTGVDEAQTIGDPAMLGTEAQGKYVIVDLKVKNTGDKAATFNAGPSQVGFDANGTEYSTSSDAMMSGSGEDMNSFLQQINPGNSVEGRLVYDVPEDTELVKLHLQGGTFSDGAEISLK